MTVPRAEEPGDDYCIEPTPPIGSASSMEDAWRDYRDLHREFPPGFHGAAPGPSRKQVIRVKATMRKIP